ncbi:hypothetical protein B6U93_03945 [Candidatus Woesearchaeota archaeon ex4484_78]|nr:MAG: hypothetical protein B6U93_03945 [Candidatus Woesearchaeota archaeon ex4484_78]
MEFISSQDPLTLEQMESLRKQFAEVTAKLNGIRQSLPDIQQYTYAVQTDVAFAGTDAASESEITNLLSYAPAEAIQTTPISTPKEIISPKPETASKTKRNHTHNKTS